jgi:hypothetical protein
VELHVLTEEEIGKIALAVITGNGGTAREDDIIAAIIEFCSTRVGSVLGLLVLRGEVGVSCKGGKVLYCKPELIGADWDYCI